MASSPIRMLVTWSVPPGESRPIVSTLQGLMIATRAEPGCTGCSLATEMGTRVVIHYVEEWNSEDDLRRQLRSNRFATLAELMERASEQPRVQFALPHGTRGLEYAEEVRRFG